VSRQARQDVLEVGVRIVTVELGRLDQAHDGSGTFPRTQTAREEPV
jgi:hypothetical protein